MVSSIDTPEKKSAAEDGDSVQVLFLPSGRRGRVPRGTNVLAAARLLGADVDSACGGRAICGRCQVLVQSGKFPKEGIESSEDNVTPPGQAEEKYARLRGLKPGRRLACQMRLLGDVVIDVPPESQLHRQLVRKEAERRAVDVNPCARALPVTVEPPSLHEPSSDLSRLLQALAEEWNVHDVEVDAAALPALQQALRAGEWQVTALVHQPHLDAPPRLIGVRPGHEERLLGLALDIGSTTIAAHLTDLHTGEVLAAKGAMNPQIRFGEDLMSRVSHAMLHENGAAEMTRVVREAINALAEEAAREAGADPADIVDVAVVGNPVMHHLFLGIDPRELGQAPFALALSEALEMAARDAGLAAIAPGARLYTLPCIAGHVGADAAAVVLAEAPHEREDITLIVDVGTNAEIILGNRERLLACSSPTGPAFEGAEITHGQRAAPGAIERVRIDRDTLKARYKVIGCELWSDAEGFKEALGELRITGICGSGIIEAVAEMYLAGIISADGRFNAALAETSPYVERRGRGFAYVLREEDPRIVITQEDVRAIQLAKAALHAGARLLMDRLGIEEPDRIRLAGAFGAHIDPLYAMVLGMIPDCDPAHVTSAGNAAGTGARMALVSMEKRREIEAVVRRIEKVETATEERFQEHFVSAMAIPHASAPLRHLRAAIDLPAQTAANSGADTRPRRRRRRRSGHVTGE
jgi:uncharacterized 2Fe-2S/4Fe-4S cluster protein (DUF4445 family)